MISQSSITNLHLVFKPELPFKSGSSLLLHSQKFLLVLDDMQRIELRYSTQQTTMKNNNTNDNQETIESNRNQFDRKITRVLGSKDVELNKWNELWITDGTTTTITDGDMKSLSDNDGKIILVIPERIHLDPIGLDGDLFVAGIPQTNSLNSRDEMKESFEGSQFLDNDKSIEGFRGCINELSINGRKYNFKSDVSGDALDGFDISK